MGHVHIPKRKPTGQGEKLMTHFHVLPQLGGLRPGNPVGLNHPHPHQSQARSQESQDRPGPGLVFSQFLLLHPTYAHLLYVFLLGLLSPQKHRPSSPPPPHSRTSNQFQPSSPQRLPAQGPGFSQGSRKRLACCSHQVCADSCYSAGGLLAINQVLAILSYLPLLASILNIYQSCF